MMGILNDLQREECVTCVEKETLSMTVFVEPTALGAIASVGVFLFTVRDDTWQQIQQFHWPMLPVLFGTVLVAWMCNGGRILVLARALGYKLNYRQAISVSLSAEFGIAATPAGVGGTVLRLALLRQANISLTKGGSMLAADVAVDLAFFSLITPAAIFVILKDPAFGGLLEEADNLHVIGLMAAVILITVGLIHLIIRPGFQRILQRLAGPIERRRFGPHLSSPPLRARLARGRPQAGRTRARSCPRRSSGWRTRGSRSRRAPQVRRRCANRS